MRIEPEFLQNGAMKAIMDFSALSKETILVRKFRESVRFEIY